MSGLVLSLFPGIGMLDMAFEEAGFCVVRGPDLLWGGDIRRFHVPAGRFDGIIGGPPCQMFSRMRHLNPAVGKHGNQIPEYERVVHEARPVWFVMENVEDAPLPVVDGYRVHAQLIRDHWVGGETQRLRRISFGTSDGRRLPVETLALVNPQPSQAVLASGNGQRVPVAIGGGGKRKKTLSDGSTVRGGPCSGVRATIEDSLFLQGLPADFFGPASPFTRQAEYKMIGNGVPLPIGRAVAAAVLVALGRPAAPASEAA